MDNLNFEEIKNEISSNFNLNKYFAKSDRKTIEEHVDDILFGLEKYLNFYSNILNEEDKLILKLAILFHDIGKINQLFQEKLKRKNVDDIIPHNCLSPLFLKKIIDKIGDFYLSLLSYIIFNHHIRGNEYFCNERYGIELLINKIRENQEKFFQQFKFSDETLNFYKNWIENAISRKKEKKFIILSGLLIRLDHAASGGLDVEEEPITKDRKEILFSYFENKGKTKSLRSFQEKFGITERKDHQAIVADTGLGKTGLSVLWSQRKKFYILPNRASVNAMYKTLCDVYGEDKVGLLHSTALYNLLDNNRDEDFSILRDYDQTKVLSKPVTVCTADQLFTAAFNMPGYEKIYATLSYSDVVIDEIQGFQPQQIIPILKQIKETKELGTRYLIITATLPDIVASKLNEYGFNVIEDDKCTFDETKRHKIKIEVKKIEEMADEVISKYKDNKKVLIVTNTVKKSQEVYKKLKEKLQNEDKKNLNLLHSRFIWKDRQDKEKTILEICEQDENGNYKDNNGCIWVCTQLVEASLDIDFDYLFTEAATADSLVQRMGRVWRHRKEDYNRDENIIIASDVEYRIYEQILVEKTLEMIKEKIKDNDNFLISSDKRIIVKELYKEENLTQWGSKYLEEWNNYEIMINSGWNFILEDNAQKAFRDVMSIELIPSKFKNQVENIYNELQNELRTIDEKKSLTQEKGKEQKRLKRVEKLKEIQSYKVPVPIYLLNPKVSKEIIGEPKPIEWIDRDYDIGILHEKYEYDCEFGLTGKVIEKEESDNII